MKKYTILLLSLPIAICVLCFSHFMEWFHFRLSNKLLLSSRDYKKKLFNFRKSLDK